MTARLAELKTEYLLSMPYSINNESALFHLKGWVDCLDSIIEAVDEVKGELANDEDDSDE